MVTDLPARPSLKLVTGDERRAEQHHPVYDDSGDLHRCGECGYTFIVDEPASAESVSWLCPPCSMASLGGGSLQQRTIDAGGALTRQTVFRR